MGSPKCLACKWGREISFCPWPLYSSTTCSGPGPCDWVSQRRGLFLEGSDLGDQGNQVELRSELPAKNLQVVSLGTGMREATRAMQRSPGGPRGPGWAGSGEWDLGRRVSREVTCVRGLSKHPGSFHRDVAFTTGADLAERSCAGRHPGSERESLCPLLCSFQCHPAKLALRGSGTLGSLT